jgi:hypothetical protein
MMSATVSIEDFCIALYCASADPNALLPDDGGRITFVARTIDEACETYYRVEI